MELVKTGVTIIIVSIVLSCTDASMELFLSLSFSSFGWLTAFDETNTLSVDTIHSIGVLVFGIYDYSFAFAWSLGYFSASAVYTWDAGDAGELVYKLTMLAATAFYGCPKNPLRNSLFWFICGISELSQMTVHLTTYYEEKNDINNTNDARKWMPKKTTVNRFHILVYFVIRIVYGTKLLLVVSSFDDDYFVLFVVFFYLSGVQYFVSFIVNTVLHTFSTILVRE
jgi:hypothetical protein